MTIEPTNVSEGLEPCPFCGATPHKGLGKVEHCQLHGEPFQRFSIWCPRRHAKITAETEAQARTAWNTRDALELTPKWVRKLAARIMVAVRQAHFPKEYAAEAHDEFEVLTLAPLLSTALATLSPPLPSRPIAWRWRYVYPDRVGHWTVRQTPIEPLAARAGYAALEVEPLYASLPSPGVERLREALQVIADRPGAGMGYAKCGGEFPIDEAANMANIARAALSALPLDGGDTAAATAPVDAATPPA